MVQSKTVVSNQGVALEAESAVPGHLEVGVRDRMNQPPLPVTKIGAVRRWLSVEIISRKRRDTAHGDKTVADSASLTSVP